MNWKARLAQTHEFVVAHWVRLFLVQAIIVFAVGYLVASMGANDSSPSMEPVDLETHVHTTSGPTLWTCSMHPQIRQPNPGKCPICGMDLIPVQKTSGGLRTLSISPDARALMQISSTPVVRDYVEHTIRMVGKVDFDETRLAYITAWVSGRLDRLYVDYTGVEVKKGDHMAYIYSEQLYAAQEELLQAIRYEKERGSSSRRLGDLNLVDAAREKLRLLGLTEEQVAEIEQRGKPSDHVTIYAPDGGIVVQKLKQEGERVNIGDRIYTIADLQQVWVHLDAYESDLPWVRYGQRVVISTEAYPGEQFDGRIAFIQPVLDDKTRTVKVRVNVPNLDGRLKPEMFVHAAVRPKIAAGGRVLDPNLAGKWISPMHPEIVKDEPGTCDICGMPLVRAESLGFVAADTDEREKPLVIPFSAALVTGTRAVVYVELPTIHSAAEPALQTLSTVVENGDLEKARDAFAKYAKMLDMPYDQPGTDFARDLWNRYADQLTRFALSGARADSIDAARRALADVEVVMTEVRERFAPVGQPTFEGREIVLGPRAGDFFLVKYGLQEGELVVTHGNFKIDAEIQIQAKPSMMTPEGGGGGGHHHGGPSASGHGDHASHQNASMSLPSDFRTQVSRVIELAEFVSDIVLEHQDLERVRSSFDELAGALRLVDGNMLTGHPRMLWKELSMLLMNDAVEGRDVRQWSDADRVLLQLKSHIRRLRSQLGIGFSDKPVVKRIEVSDEFRAELTRLWQAYVRLQRALANDDFQAARGFVVDLETALSAVRSESLDEAANRVWEKERDALQRLLKEMKKANDIKALRSLFAPVSDEMSVFVRTFGIANVESIFELHCPMAMEGRGAIWLQPDKQTKNPYYGATMLKCADRVEPIQTKQDQ